jgi:L-asparaginase II
MLTVDIALPDVEELHKLVLEGQEKGYLTYDEIAAAMRAHPELISGDGGTDTELMRTFEGFSAKGGAEGLLCAAGPDGLGIALKSEDGAYRAIRPALAHFIGRLGSDPGDFGEVVVHNTRGEPVGELVTL